MDRRFRPKKNHERDFDLLGKTLCGIGSFLKAFLALSFVLLFLVSPLIPTGATWIMTYNVKAGATPPGLSKKLPTTTTTTTKPTTTTNPPTTTTTTRTTTTTTTRTTTTTTIPTTNPTTPQPTYPSSPLPTYPQPINPGPAKEEPSLTNNPANAQNSLAQTNSETVLGLMTADGLQPLPENGSGADELYPWLKESEFDTNTPSIVTTDTGSISDTETLAKIKAGLERPRLLEETTASPRKRSDNSLLSYIPFVLLIPTAIAGFYAKSRQFINLNR